MNPMIWALSKYGGQLNSYLCNELQNEPLFCTRHDNWTTSVNEWSNMCAKKIFAKRFFLI
jgi:hypothetical protein